MNQLSSYNYSQFIYGKIIGGSSYETVAYTKDLTNLDECQIIANTATSQKPLRGKMKATTASLASQPIACGC
jgi:hypothetical protein